MKKKDSTVTFSNAWRKSKKMYIIATIFVVVSLGFILAGIYVSIIEDTWIFLFVFGFMAAIFSLIAFVLWPSKRMENYTIELQQDGIFQQWENEATNERKSEFIPYDLVEDVLIGIFEQRHIGYKIPDWYTIHALLIIKYQDDYFFSIINEQEDLHMWVEQLKGRVLTIRYTDKDLSKAFFSRKYMKIDFTSVNGTTEDIVSEHFGKEPREKLFYEWMPEHLFKKLNQKKQELYKPKTRKAEKVTMWVMLIYNTLFAMFIFPLVPIDDDGMIAFSNIIYWGYLIMNFGLPIVLVYWRSFTRWYNPILYFVAGMGGNFIGTIFASMTNEILFDSISIIFLNTVNLFLWFAGLIVVKLFKLLYTYVENSKSVPKT